MKGSPAKLGKIQGTAGHSSALKYAKVKVPPTPPVSEEKDEPKLTKHGTKTYKTAWEGLSKEKREKHGSYEGFVKAAEKWWASKEGQKKASAKGSKFAHRIKKEETKPETKTEVTEVKPEEKKDLVKTVGDKLKEGLKRRKISDAEYKKNRKAGESKYQYNIRMKKKSPAADYREPKGKNQAVLHNRDYPSKEHTERHERRDKKKKKEE